MLELRDGPEPDPGPGQLLVELEGAGTVAWSGERVAWVAAPGSYAEARTR